MLSKKSLKILVTSFISFCFAMLPTVSALAAAMTVDLSNVRTGSMRKVRITTGNVWPFWSKTTVYVCNTGQGTVNLYPMFGNSGPSNWIQLMKGQQRGFEATGRYKSYYLQLQPGGRTSRNKVYITVSGNGSSIQVVN